MRLVIDTNIIISALIKEGITREIINNPYFQFFTPSFTLSEINKYKEEICNKARFDIKDFYILLEMIMSYIKIVNLEFYKHLLEKTGSLIGDIDDIPFLALALFLDCPIWSDDKHFKKQKAIKVLTTKDVLNLFKREK